MRCLDERVAAQLFANGLLSAPSDGVYFPEACYRCVENAVCASNGTFCQWSTSFKQCIDTCSNPTVNVTLPCTSRSMCGCLNATATCSWCQYSQNFTDSTGESYTTSMGRCMENSIADKCTGDLSCGGYMGHLFRVKPEDCSSTSISPNVVDPSTLVSDAQIANILKQVSDGSFTALGFQRILNQLNVTKIMIRDISPPCTDGTNGKIQFTFDNFDNLTNDEIVEYLIQALANNFNVDRNQISIQILPSSSSKKRQVGSPSTSLAISDITASNGSTPSVNPSPSVDQPSSNGPAPAINPNPDNTNPAPYVDQQPASNDTDTNPAPYVDQQPASNDTDTDNTNPAPAFDQQPASNDTDPAGKPIHGNSPGPAVSGAENATPSAGAHISPLWFLSMLLVVFWM